MEDTRFHDPKYMFLVSRLMDLLNENYHLAKIIYERKHYHEYPISQDQFRDDYLESIKNPPAKQNK